MTNKQLYDIDAILARSNSGLSDSIASRNQRKSSNMSDRSTAAGYRRGSSGSSIAQESPRKSHHTHSSRPPCGVALFEPLSLADEGNPVPAANYSPRSAPIIRDGSSCSTDADMKLSSLPEEMNGLEAHSADGDALKSHFYLHSL